jgi:hypothetical protein
MNVILTPRSYKKIGMISLTSAVKYLSFRHILKIVLRGVNNL